MGNPVTMAVIGGGLGAMMNEKDPLKGALLGAAGGYGGATLFGPTTAGLTPGIVPSSSVLSGSTTAATNPALVTSALPTSATNVGFQTTAQQVASQMPTNIANEAMKSAGTGIFAPPVKGFQSLTQGMTQPLTYDSATAAGLQRPLSLGMTGVEPGQGYEYTLGDRLGQVGQYAQQNPVLTNQALGYAQQAMQQPPEQPLAPGQINRGQIQPMDYMSLLNPQQSTVLRPQPISLLG